MATRMTIQDFIKTNKNEIDQCIKSACGENTKIDNNERRMWVLNDESIYQWAKDEGVQLQ